MEDNLNKRQEAKAEHKRASKIIFVFAVLLVVAIVLSIITAIILLLFPVSEIEVVGDSRYNYSEIIDAAGIKKGARLYYLNEEKAENAIFTAFPYLKYVKIHTYFPNRVQIEIKEFEVVYLIPHTNGYCYVNGDFEILEIVSQAPDYESFSGIFIKLENAATGDVGSIFESEDTIRAKELISVIKNCGFYNDLNIVDVDNKYDNSFIVGKKYKFVIGAMTDVKDKMKSAFEIYLGDDFKKENNAVIDVTDKKKVFLRYVDDENIRAEFDFCQK